MKYYQPDQGGDRYCDLLMGSREVTRAGNLKTMGDFSCIRPDECSAGIKTTSTDAGRLCFEEQLTRDWVHSSAWGLVGNVIFIKEQFCNDDVTGREDSEQNQVLKRMFPVSLKARMGDTEQELAGSMSRTINSSSPG